PLAGAPEKGPSAHRLADFGAGPRVPARIELAASATAAGADAPPGVDSAPLVGPDGRVFAGEVRRPRGLAQRVASASLAPPHGRAIQRGAQRRGARGGRFRQVPSGGGVRASLRAVVL